MGITVPRPALSAAAPDSATALSFPRIPASPLTNAMSTMGEMLGLKMDADGVFLSRSGTRLPGSGDGAGRV